ncbi:hypothetical protein AVEN_104928-1 [Araneus ventricosus]|uniref:DUF4371 domain-containing protein n=1 Tax=Araneus ventricosus TaxID=182803 RepID=A0A4Y2PXZ0_ARAVE|nr:hypothetical protein AVEN_104928-1 [Araneus ventricosus]
MSASHRESSRISYGQIWSALSCLDCSDNIQKLLALAHISVLHEPGGQYVDHVTPASRTGSDITKCILKYLDDNDVYINELESIDFKGTVTNTGWKNGVICNTELKIQRLLQWFICLLHFNELPFEHLFEHFDGETTGPASFCGKIGKQLTSCEKLLIINFEAIELDQINTNKTDLSKDQQYPLDIVRAIQTGQCAPDLAVRDPGALSHSRWLTCVNRVLPKPGSFPKQALQTNLKCSCLVCH